MARASYRACARSRTPPVRRWCCSARAVPRAPSAWELAFAGAKRIVVVNRGTARGHGLADVLNAKTKAKAEFVDWRGDFAIPPDADIAVNATSVGLYPDVEARLDIAPGSYRAGLVVADVIPNPPRTRLIREAEARGARVLDGLGMLVNQGVIGIKYWTGVDADAGVMRRTLEASFGT